MKPSRNDPCSCGSGKKYKHCCESKQSVSTTAPRSAFPIAADFDPLVALFNARCYAELESQVRNLLVTYPEAPFAWQLLGGALQMQGKDALAAFQKTASLSPNDVGAHFNLGVAYKSAGKLEQAAASYRRALAIKPDYLEALSNLGNVLQDLEQLDESVRRYRQALVIQPKSADTHYNLGNALRGLKQLEQAAQSYRQAVNLNPNFGEALSNLSTILRTFGRTEEALLYSRRAFELNSHSLQHAIQAHLLLPVIPVSVDDVTTWRERFQNGITALLNLPPFADVSLEHLSGASFYLAYHNTSDRPVMEALRHLYRTRVPDLTFTAPNIANWQTPGSRGQRIKVGFLSEYLTDHTIGKHYKGFIAHLDRSRFEVVVIHTPKAKQDAFRSNLDALADKAIALPPKLKQQQQVVASEQLDVLFYPDIGMSSVTYFLAYARLAPVQATSWGHPDTSGLDTMDYYVAATSNEAEGAQDNYTERLVRLNRLPCFYYQTPVTATLQLTKAELGLPTVGTLYGCPQALFKIHPDFDAVLADIAAGDPSGHLILPEGTYSEWTALLKARWAKTHPILIERVVFMPRMKWEQFMAMMSHMDVLLDPLHFGSGNTFYDAMVCGTPVVTWPGTFGRGRNVAAAYQQMGITDAPVAKRIEDYAPLALALGRDPVRRQALRKASLEAASQYLFEDRQAVREFESFLEDAVAAAGRSEKLAENWSPSIR
jgi:predicted O-linked N-acetylglucosamine transferase (SPINDLY family)